MNTVDAFARMRHSQHLAVFYRQWATAEATGLPLRPFLESLESSSAPVVQARVRAAVRALDQGHLALTESEDGFSEVEVAFLELGQSTGGLDASLAALAAMFESDQRTVRYAKREATYPMVVALCACWIPTLPLAFFSGVWLWVLLGVLGTTAVFFLGGVAIWRYFVWLRGRPKLAKIRFFWALSAALEAGLLLDDALPLAAKAAAPSELSQSLRYVVPNGRPLTELLQMAGVFEPATLSMLTTGEAAGRLPEALDRVARYLESGVL